MRYESKRTIFLFIGILFGIIVLQMLPFRVPYKIKVPGKIMPEKQWILQRENDGSLMATYYNHKTGLIEDYSAAQIERGDAINFHLWPSMFNKKFINAGDTVGVIQSKEIDFQLQELNRDLVTAQASLELNLTGEKKQLVQEAREQLLLAQENLKNQKMIFARKDSLFRLNLISSEEYEIQKSTARVLEIEGLVAKSHVEVLETGAKPELINMIKVEIEAIKKQIQSLQARKTELIMIAPFPGKLFRSFSGDTLLTVADTNLVILLPIQLGNMKDVQIGQTLTCTIPGVGARDAKIFHLEEKVRYINNQQVIVGLGRFEKTMAYLPVNMIVSCSIYIEGMKPLSYFIKYFRRIVS